MRSFATLRTTEKPSHSELADARRLQCALDDVLHEADEGCVRVGRDAVAPRDAVSAAAVDQAEADADMVQRHFFLRRVAEAGIALHERERRHYAVGADVRTGADGQYVGRYDRKDAAA